MITSTKGTKTLSTKQSFDKFFVGRERQLPAMNKRII